METPTPKRPRALPKVWQRFLYLEINDGFYIGRCAYVKTGFFEGTTRKEGTFRTIRVWPWTRVQTNVLVRDARPGGKSSPPPFTVGPVLVDVDSDCLPSLDGCISDKLANPGRTHFFGNNCPGGHADPPVNNDNSITGPTC